MNIFKLEKLIFFSFEVRSLNGEGVRPPTVHFNNLESYERMEGHIYPDVWSRVYIIRERQDEGLALHMIFDAGRYEIRKYKIEKGQQSHRLDTST